MSLQPGSRLGPYEIVSALGAGGMGEVYRARDPKLNRHVALKILPDIVSLDPDRLARFAREAQVLASLNHPHIAAIYGFEESNSVRALVLEFAIARHVVAGTELSPKRAAGAPTSTRRPVSSRVTVAGRRPRAGHPGSRISARPMSPCPRRPTRT